MADWGSAAGLASKALSMVWVRRPRTRDGQQPSGSPDLIVLKFTTAVALDYVTLG